MKSKILKYNMLIHFRPWPNTVIWFAVISMLWSCVTFSQAVSQNIAFSSREVTSFYGDQYLNPYIQPNYKNAGNFHLNYYGSGDVTGDNQITWDDYEAILNSQLDQADVDGNGIPGEQADKDLLESYLTDQIPYLPGHFEFNQDSTEKISWIEKVLAIDQTNTHPPGPNWDCDQYAIQTQINLSGVENISGAFTYPSVYDTTMNARFNLPVYQVFTRYQNGQFHTINAVLIGDNPTNFNDWYFFEPQNDARVYPGSPSMNPNSFANIKKYVYFWNEIFEEYQYGTMPVVNFNLTNGNPTLGSYDPNLITSPPEELSYIHPGGIQPADTTVNVEEGTSPSVTGEVIGNESWSSTSYSDSTNQGQNPYFPEYHNYNIWRSWKAVSDSNSLIDTTYSSLNPIYGRNPQLITVQDTTKPGWNSFPPAYSYVPYGSGPGSYPTGQDNSGYYSITDSTVSTKGENPFECEFYNYVDSTFYHIEDPSENSRDSLAVREYYLEDPVFTYVPPTQNNPFWASFDPDSTGGYATAISPTGIPVVINYNDNFNQNPDSTDCGHYNYDGNRTWTATDTICGTSSNMEQYFLIYKPNTLKVLEHPRDTIISRNESTHPDNLGYEIGQDTALLWSQTISNWYDELISATPTDSTWHRHWSQEDAICSYLTTPDSIQIITKDLTTGIDENSKFPENKLKIYPNPGSDIITVEYHATMPEKVLLELSSATGAVLLAEIREADSGINLYMLDISRFPGGIYLLRLTSGLDVLHKVMIK